VPALRAFRVFRVFRALSWLSCSKLPLCPRPGRAGTSLRSSAPPLLRSPAPPAQSSTVTKYYYIGGQRVALRQGGTLYYLLMDHPSASLRAGLGSTALTVNSSGVRVAELRYRPYGETRYTCGTTPTTFNFTGQRLDSSTNLLYYGARS